MDRLEVIADTYLSMNAPIQLAATVLLDQRKNIQPLLLDRLRVNLAQLDDQLKGRSQPNVCRLMEDGMPCCVYRSPEPTRIWRLHCSARPPCWSIPATFTIFPTTGI